jgi:archaellum component FlaC
MVKLNLNVFGKKKSASGGPQMEAPRGRIPVSDVRALSARGVPEPDIIRTLRNEGYSTGEIDTAMKDALRDRISGPQGYNQGPQQRYVERPMPPARGFPPLEEDDEDLPAPLGRPRQPQEFAGRGMPDEPMGSDFGGISPSSFRPRSPDEDFDEPGFEEPAQGPYGPRPIPNQGPRGMPPGRRPGPGQQARPTGRKEMEELAEVVVDEKLREMHNRVNAFQTSFQQLNAEIEMLNNEITRIRSEKLSEVKEIEAKIDDYKQCMTDMAGRIDSMEHALRDSLSPMLESLRSLSETIKLLKSAK